MGVVNRLVYDGNGNITKSGTVQPDAQDKGIWIARSFTTDKTMWRLSQTQRATEPCMTGM